MIRVATCLKTDDDPTGSAMNGHDLERTIWRARSVNAIGAAAAPEAGVTLRRGNHVPGPSISDAPAFETKHSRLAATVPDSDWRGIPRRTARLPRSERT